MGDSITSNKYTYLYFNHINYFQHKEITIYQNIKDEIKAEYEALDKKLRESNMRKQKDYVIKGYVPRTIITIFREITFIRTKYQYFDAELNKNKTVYLLDNYIQIEPYQRMNLHLRLEIMKQYQKENETR